MKKTYFIDTSYFIALASKLDQYHDKAVKLAKQILSKNIKLITSEFILLEVGNSFSKMHLKQKGINIIKSVYDDENIELIKSENYDILLGTVIVIFVGMLSIASNINLTLLLKFNCILK